ncbi:MAG: fibrobacter succinogenes major paralogous domain-containing protein [Bacteroidales bacterium]|nr:fibrobacter succinogenes major paralogous domain-containing protein [Bacteroidales bacterium]
MRRNILALFSLLILFTVSCKHSKDPAEKEGYIEYQGSYYKEIAPIKYDSNKDGVIDENDGTIEILGTNINVTQNPDGSPFYSGKTNGEGEEGEGETQKPSVAVGEKLCYHDVEKYCSKNGGLYAFETSVNQAQSGLVQSYTDADANNNKVADYIEEIRSSANIEKVAFEQTSKYATEIAKKIEKLAKKQIGTNYLYLSIKEAVENALREVLYESNENINVTNVETIVNARVSVAIVNAVADAEIINYIEDQEALATLATTYADLISKETADHIAEQSTKAILSQYEKQIANGTIQNVQGICPNGYHIPSDFEWMIFESAIGMSDADLAKGGETEINRGADAKVVEKMVKEYGFNYGGYASINGTFAQLDEAGVYWSSTTGHDDKGDYVWVRQIDKSYPGVVRFKMYEKSGLSVRCFKD